MMIARFAVLTAFLLSAFLFSACVSSGVPPQERAEAAPETTAPAPTGGSAPEAKPRKEVQLPPDWLMVRDSSGRPVVVHLPDGAENPDGYVMFGLRKAVGESPKDQANGLREDLRSAQADAECDDLSVSEDGSRASFSCSGAKSADGSPRMMSRVLLRSLPNDPGKTLGCFGYWTEDVHQGLAADLDLISDGIIAYMAQFATNLADGSSPGMLSTFFQERVFRSATRSPPSVTAR